MVYLLALHVSALQTNTTKFKQDFIGPLFIDTALDKTHYRLKDMTGLLLDGTYHVNRIKKGSAHTPLGIVDKFDTYKTALKLPHLSDLEQRIPNFLNCDNYGSLTASNPDPLLDNAPTNDNELHQVICNTFKINYFQEMDTIIKL